MNTDTPTTEPPNNTEPPNEAGLVPWPVACRACLQGNVPLYGCGTCALLARLQGKDHPDTLYRAEELYQDTPAPRGRLTLPTEDECRTHWPECGHHLLLRTAGHWKTPCDVCHGTGQILTYITAKKAAARRERQAQAEKQKRYILSAALDMPRHMAKKFVPRCGALAKTTGQPCQASVTGNGLRCKLHGGLSTGPKTEEGRQRIADSNRRRGLQKRLEKAALAARLNALLSP